MIFLPGYFGVNIYPDLEEETVFIWKFSDYGIFFQFQNYK